MSDYKKMIDFFDEYIMHYKELLNFENKKLELIVSNKALDLSDSLSKEQAYIMKGRSLEAKRISLLKEEGFDNMKFQEIIENAPKEYSTKLQTKFNELSKYVNEVKYINDNAMVLVKEKLSQIETKLDNKGNDYYDVKGGKKHSTGAGPAVVKNV